MRQTELQRANVTQYQRPALIIGIAGLVICVIGAFLDTEQFFRSYLFAFVFWVGFPLGCLAIACLHELTGGAWGLVIRRIVEAGALTIPLMALLFVPLLFGLGTLYPWARPEVVAVDELIQHKQLYLNVPFFIGRMVLYFGVWIVLAYLLNRWTADRDRVGGSGQPVRLRLVGRIGLVMYLLLVSFAAFDWGMSLEPHWFSTMYGVTYAIGYALSSLAFAIIVLRWLSTRPPVAGVATPSHFHDLGNLLMAFVILWAYMNFSQYLIVWLGNLPEEVIWFVPRITGGWEYVILAVIAFQFVLPLLLLLVRTTKRKSTTLATLAFAILFFRLLDMFWVIMPSFYHDTIHLHWLDIVAPIGMGGLWVAAFLWLLSRRPLLPLYDSHEAPALHGAAEHG